MIIKIEPDQDQEISVIKIEQDQDQEKSVIKIEPDQDSCAACKILQFYSNKDTFISDVQCVFCGKIISKQ